jgi:hypothetical protein
VPFVRAPLPKLPAFIPAYQAALFFIDLITAVLLIDQFLRLRSTVLWQRDLRVVDLWLMLVMWIWLFDIALAAILGQADSISDSILAASLV